MHFWCPFSAHAHRNVEVCLTDFYAKGMSL